METTIIIMLAIAVVAQGIISNRAIDNLSEDIDHMADCHNRLCELVKEVCDSLNESGIPAPEVNSKN